MVARAQEFEVSVLADTALLLGRAPRPNINLRVSGVNALPTQHLLLAQGHLCKTEPMLGPAHKGLYLHDDCSFAALAILGRCVTGSASQPSDQVFRGDVVDLVPDVPCLEGTRDLPRDQGATSISTDSSDEPKGQALITTSG